MPTRVQTTTGTSTTGTLNLRGSQSGPATEAFPDLAKNGFAVIPGILSRERAAEYVDRSYQWLESFGLGFQRDDPVTWHLSNLPSHNRGGLFNRHGINHEQYVWDIRTEATLIEAFAKIWGTEQLLVSFDGANISIPVPKEELGQMAVPWPHVDQSPLKRQKHCVQGIMNLGSFELFNEFFDSHANQAPTDGWSKEDFYPHTVEQVEWFYERGCTWEKVCAAPGDLILWDSRCIHYGSIPKGNQPRVATYICYKPAEDITPEMLERKQKVARDMSASSHDPLHFRMTGALEKGKMNSNERLAPAISPILTERAKQLSGLVPY